MSPSVVYTDLAGTTDNVWVEYNATTTATGNFITLFSRAGHTNPSGASNAFFYLDQVSLIKQSTQSSIKDLWTFYG